MPAKLNIGLSQRAAESGGGAREASLHLELEVEPGLIADSPRLHKRVRQLFCLMRSALAEELSRPGGSKDGVDVEEAPARPTVPQNNGGRQSGSVRLATPAQVKAIYAVAKQQGVNLAELLQQQHGVKRPEDLTVRQASWVIDHLKGTGGLGGG